MVVNCRWSNISTIIYIYNNNYIFFFFFFLNTIYFFFLKVEWRSGRSVVVFEANKFWIKQGTLRGLTLTLLHTQKYKGQVSR